MLTGHFGLPYEHNDYKEKVNYLTEMKNESRKT